MLPVSWDAIQFLWKALTLRRISAPKNPVIRETYPGLDGLPVSLKVILPKGKAKRIVIFYPGASPFAEDHEEATSIADIMAGLGYKVYMPRIPLLKKLIITPENVEWMIHFYQWILRKETDFSRQISVIGMSFGGAMLLKASMDPRMQSPCPASILVYGTFYDFNSSMNYLITGKYNNQGIESYLKPNDWGGIVIMYNFLARVDTGYDTVGIRKNLTFRVANEMERGEDHLKSLPVFDQAFLKSLMTAE